MVVVSLKGGGGGVVVGVEEGQFVIYVNDVRQGRYFDYSKQRTEGTFAFLGNQDSGEGTCNFENSWVWALE